MATRTQTHTVKTVASVIIVALTGCASVERSAPIVDNQVTQRHSPYEGYLPQTKPSETNRVFHPAGFSIVCPPGWTSRTLTIEPFLKDWLSDQLVLEGPQKDEYKPTLEVQRVGPSGEFQWNNALQPGWKWRENLVFTNFQGGPAFSQFQTGNGRFRTVGGYYLPVLEQSLTFKSQGKWFRLIFYMRNAGLGEPYYKQPLEIVQEYFETFRYEPASK